MRIWVHPRVTAKRPGIMVEDVVAAFSGTLRRIPRVGTTQWVGIGIDGRGRLLEYVAVENGADHWMVFHAMPATKKVLRELGLEG